VLGDPAGPLLALHATQRGGRPVSDRWEFRLLFWGVLAAAIIGLVAVSMAHDRAEDACTVKGGTIVVDRYWRPLCVKTP
jgi:hypothetical protein